ncbi:unnamed protein product [Urochloa humidicola]
MGRLDFQGALVHSQDLQNYITSELIPSIFEFEVTKFLGKGSTCGVHKCFYRDADSTQYAIKVMRIIEEYDFEARNGKEPREVAIHSSFRDQHIPRFYEAWAASGNFSNYLHDNSMSSDDTQEAFIHWEGSLVENSSGSSDFDVSLYEPGGALYKQYKGALFAELGDDFLQCETALVKELHGANDDLHEENYVFIQMEHCMSTLEGKLLAEDHKIETCKAWALFEDITEAIKIIHEKEIVHGDLKPGNISLGSTHDVKIGDFGQSFFIHNKSGIHGGTPGYSAPELDGGQEFCYEVDVYSLGAIFLELFYRFKDETDKAEKFWSLRKNEIPEDWEGDTILLKKLTAQPFKRPSTNEILVIHYTQIVIFIIKLLLTLFLPCII